MRLLLAVSSSLEFFYYPISRFWEIQGCAISAERMRRIRLSM
nr:MAG TPA: hypothetical protein [Caudoviricetes sp.]